MAPKRKRAAVAEEKELDNVPEQEVDTDSAGKTTEKGDSKRKREKAVKKQDEGSDSNEAENEKKPPRRTRGKPPKKVEEDADSDESEPEEKPAKKSRAAKSKQENSKETEPVEKAKRSRYAKKKEESSSNEDSESEEKPPKKGKAAKKREETSESGESEPEEKPTKKKKSKKETKVAAKKGDKKKAEGDKVKNQTSTTYSDIDFTSCENQNSDGNEWNFKISSWNVDGIRAWIKKGGLTFLDYEKPDVFCLQETKCSEEKLPPEILEEEGYKLYWHCSKKDGYAGVGLYSKQEPISIQYGLGVKAHDDEGRMITAEYEKFYVISVYVPNAGRGLVTLPKRLEWNEDFRKYVNKLNKKKPVIICGDMNVAHTEIDLANPKTNTKNAGFTKEEREGMTEFLSDGYVDTFRKFYPDQTQAYTFWTYMSNARSRNIGWRLDYFIVSENFMDCVCDNKIRSAVYGSDHCPITLFLSV